MRVIYATHPDQALHDALNVLMGAHAKEDSRNGPVLRFTTPVTSVWEPGFNCVSVDPGRDANPFLHYIESFWMLAGKNDVETVAKLAANMANYSDDGETLHGAYGHRWREWFGIDQINQIITELIANPTSRRCVLQMWDGSVDLGFAILGKKDVPCNTAIYFDPLGDELNMTVSNRSNDLVWGAYGANVVHMSMLHSYVAHMVGKKVGTYYQMSNNLHLYADFPITQKLVDLKTGEVKVRPTTSTVKMTNLFSDVGSTDSEFVGTIRTILSQFLSPGPNDLIETQFKSLNLLITFCRAFNLYKAHGPNEAVSYLEHFTWESAPEDDPRTSWINAATAWLKRRPSYKALNDE
jgi:thymidylate synthase